MSDNGDGCRCFLPVRPPQEPHLKWWRPDVDHDPGPHVQVIARYGEDPNLRRAVRLPDGRGWAEEGHMVNFYADITPPMPWERVGRCWDDTPHPVVRAYRRADGIWVADGT